MKHELRDASVVSVVVDGKGSGGCSGVVLANVLSFVRQTLRMRTPLRPSGTDITRPIGIPVVNSKTNRYNIFDVVECSNRHGDFRACSLRLRIAAPPGQRLGVNFAFEFSAVRVGVACGSMGLLPVRSIVR
jgi:hypothetical protein